MTEFVNKFLLAGDKFMPWFHLRQPGFTHSVCALFTKHRKRILKSTDASNLKHIYKNKLDKACFAHDASYANSTYLGKRNISDKALKVNLLKLQEILNMMDIQKDSKVWSVTFLLRKQDGEEV